MLGAFFLMASLLYNIPSPNGSQFKAEQFLYVSLYFIHLLVQVFLLSIFPALCAGRVLWDAILAARACTFACMYVTMYQQYESGIFC